ncbi:ABC transporter substrate-binding protein [Irregularibacter muris]|uniref:ABC transporter substrate-binding protein n=1 Tax=Irregularibacter muris TaxID=1796619 RepID=A0AAE3L3T3_9FIRM|nr:ABC transporter substrate-binding protein [Irregularibacter muris]MCR1898803.1 ABC transporter substrate-binding protein [Irregularibacter muris]
MGNISRKKKLMYLIGICLLVTSMVLSLTACGGTKDNPDNSSDKEEISAEEKITDAMGNEVTVPSNPERVIASYLEDHLVALGIKPVAQWSVNDGASIQGYLQDALEGIPTIPHDLPFEAVQQFSPDLIIMNSASMVEGGKYDQYNKIAPTYVIGTEESNNWRDQLLRVGKVFNKTEEAEKVLEEYDQKAEESKAKIESAVGNPSVAAIWLVGGNFFVVNESLSSGTVMYEDLGLKVPEVVKEISSSGESNWNAISLEKLVELDAEHIFLINSDTASGSTALSDTLWKSIPAVKAGNVYEFSPDESWLYTGAIANEQIIDNVLESLVE